MRKLTPIEETALAILEREGPLCPGIENDMPRLVVRSVFDGLAKKKRVAVEMTDDGPRYSLIPGVLS
jgi:hypothetical protein